MLIGSAVAPTTTTGLDHRDEGVQLRLDHSNWLLPAWTAGGPAVWTIVGAPFAVSDTIVAPDGSFAPRNHGPAVTYWLYDLDANRLLVPAEHTPQVRLDDNHLPIVTSTWQMDDLEVESTYFSGWPGGDVGTWFAGHAAGSDEAVAFVRLSVTTTGPAARHLAVYVALRSFGIERDMHAISSITCQPETATLVANDAIVLTGTRPADACGGAPLSQDDMSAFALRDQVPGQLSVRDPAGRAGGLLRLLLTATPDTPGRIELRAPTAARSPTPERLAALTQGAFDDERARVAQAWRQALARTTFDVSDARFNDAFMASQAYLLLNRQRDRPRSGPLAHDAFWTRDAAYVGEALERVGYGSANGATLEALLGTQQADGSFPAITDVNGPRPVQEWDAPGEAIWALVSHYRFSRDRAWLQQVYPALVRAASFLDALRARTAAEGPETRGLLPANASAEDLGPDTWHHYWDDLWALAGYRDVTFAARELGKADEAEAFQHRADEFQQVLLQSIRAVQARTGKSFVPNGPEDELSSSMARGTTPALWPARALQGPDAWDLLVRSFRHYHKDWIDPQGGAYRHYQDTLWPYGGLGIAHAMLRLGLLEPTWQVLGWTVDHPTLPGVYAWGEAINPRHGGLELGDMPHSWAAAEYISLVRDMVLTEDGGALVVNGGTPEGWLDASKHVILRDAPTHFGLVSVSLTRLDPPEDSSPPDLRVELAGDPPEGWWVRLPDSLITVLVDDTPTPVGLDHRFRVPSGMHDLLVRYAPSPTNTAGNSPGAE